MVRVFFYLAAIFSISAVVLHVQYGPWMVDGGPDAHIYRWWKNACLVLAVISWTGLGVAALATALF